MSVGGARIEPFNAPIDADVSVPGSKSLTNRALMVAALASGESEISGVLFADDTEAMMAALGMLGASMDVRPQSETVVVRGRGRSQLESDRGSGPVRIDARQSGTTSRFILAALALTPGEWLLDGDDQLRARPFVDQIAALHGLGARIEGVDGPDRLPLLVTGKQLAGGRISLAGDTSSQYLSGLLLSGPLTANGLTVEVTTDLVSRSYVDMTVAVMRAFGAEVEENDNVWSVAPRRYRGTAFVIEPDASAASYFFATAAMTRGRCRVRGLSQDSLQGDIGFVDVLGHMGATVTRGKDWTEVSASGPLHGVAVDMSQISDTAQTMAVVAATASGRTKVSGIGFIQEKETRRIDAVVRELNRVGVGATGTGDGFVIDPSPIRGGAVETYGDHRMAMSFALLGLVAEGITITDPDCVNKTFPTYWHVLESVRPTAAPRVVAIDGPAGSGKSTVAKALARELDVVHFDTGAMYRAVAYAVLERGIDPGDSDGVAELAHGIVIELDQTVIVDGVDATDAIRSPEVTAIVSATSAVPAVRTEMVRRQRNWARRLKGCVLEGRDIGTVVFPDAPVKAYLTARVEVRAQRRFAESVGQTIEEIVADIERRDLADSTREVSPLRAADDAIIIDTSDRPVSDIVVELADITRRVWSEGETANE